MPSTKSKAKRKPARRARVRVAASTSNLGPGFDCLGLALSLHNAFVFEPADDVSVVVKFNGCDDFDGQMISPGRKNLVWRAAGEVFRRAGVKVKGLKITMTLAVPLSRGLGSSATAIIAGVVGANALIGEPFDEGELFDLIVNLEGHPDNVAASYYGGLTAAMLRKRSPKVVRYKVSPRVRAVVAIPPYGLSTEKARAALPREVAFRDAVHNLSRVPFVVHALSQGALDELSWAMEDRLHEPYRIALLRNGRAIQKAAIAAGASGCAISGAGPSLVALCREAEAPAVAEAMTRQMKGGRVEILSIEKKGVRVSVTP